MTIDHAQKARLGDKVRYRSTEETIAGTVTEVRYDGLTIMWDDGLYCVVSCDKQKCREHLNDIEFC
jgi:sRNA-binding protein